MLRQCNKLKNILYELSHFYVSSRKSRKNLHEFIWYLWSLKCIDHWGALVFICVFKHKILISFWHIHVLSFCFILILSHPWLIHMICSHDFLSKVCHTLTTIDYIDYNSSSWVLNWFHIVHDQCCILSYTMSRQPMKHNTTLHLITARMKKRLRGTELDFQVTVHRSE